MSEQEKKWKTGNNEIFYASLLLYAEERQARDKRKICRPTHIRFTCCKQSLLFTTAATMLYLQLYSSDVMMVMMKKNGIRTKRKRYALIE